MYFLITAGGKQILHGYKNYNLDNLRSQQMSYRDASKYACIVLHAILTSLDTDTACCVHGMRTMANLHCKG